MKMMTRLKLLHLVLQSNEKDYHLILDYHHSIFHFDTCNFGMLLSNNSLVSQWADIEGRLILFIIMSTPGTEKLYGRVKKNS